MAKLRRKPDVSVSNGRRKRGCTALFKVQEIRKAWKRRRAVEKIYQGILRGAVTQWLECLLCKQDVEGSNPFGSTITESGTGEKGKPFSGSDARNAAERGPRKVPEGAKRSRGPWPTGGNFLGAMREEPYSKA